MAHKAPNRERFGVVTVQWLSKEAFICGVFILPISRKKPQIIVINKFMARSPTRVCRPTWDPSTTSANCNLTSHPRPSVLPRQLHGCLLLSIPYWLPKPCLPFVPTPYAVITAAVWIPHNNCYFFDTIL